MATRSTTRPAAPKKATAGPKPKVFVTDEDLMHFRKKDGGEIILDLDFPSDILRSAIQEDLTEQEQFDLLIGALGNDDLQAEINSLGALEYMRLITAFFGEFQKAAGGLGLGESVSSSASSTSID